LLSQLSHMSQRLLDVWRTLGQTLLSPFMSTSDSFCSPFFFQTILRVMSVMLFLELAWNCNGGAFSLHSVLECLRKR
jgi:hypothetical protein